MQIEANIVQESNRWLVSGPVLVDNANTLLLASEVLSFSQQSHQIDFLNVTEVDTAAISLMMEWQRRATSANCKATFSNLPANLSSLALLYGVSEFIPISQ